MKNWLINNKKENTSQHELFLDDINQALKSYKMEKEVKINDIATLSNRVIENIKKASSSERMIYSNHKQEYYSSSSREMLRKSNYKQEYYSSSSREMLREPIEKQSYNNINKTKNKHNKNNNCLIF